MRWARKPSERAGRLRRQDRHRRRASRPGSTWASRWPRSLAGETVAQAIQLGIEYDPQPPFDSGSPEKAPAEVVELLRSRSRHQITEEQEPLAAGG